MIYEQCTSKEFAEKLSNWFTKKCLASGAHFEIMADNKNYKVKITVREGKAHSFVIVKLLPDDFDVRWPPVQHGIDVAKCFIEEIIYSNDLSAIITYAILVDGKCGFYSFNKPNHK